MVDAEDRPLEQASEQGAPQAEDDNEPITRGYFKQAMAEVAKQAAEEAFRRSQSKIDKDVPRIRDEVLQATIGRLGYIDQQYGSVMSPEDRQTLSSMGQDLEMQRHMIQRQKDILAASRQTGIPFEELDRQVSSPEQLQAIVNEHRGKQFEERLASQVASRLGIVQDNQRQQASQAHIIPTGGAPRATSVGNMTDEQWLARVRSDPKWAAEHYDEFAKSRGMQ